MPAITAAPTAVQSGLVEAIEDGGTGLAVVEGDATATADAIVSLLRDSTGRCDQAEQLAAQIGLLQQLLAPKAGGRCAVVPAGDGLLGRAWV